MNQKYEYLHQFIENESNTQKSNYFQIINPKEIIEAEQEIGFEFPESLKEFWLEVGCGFLDMSIKNEPGEYETVNLILSPYVIAKTILRTEEAAIIDYVLEDYLQKGDVPFFEIGNSDYFLKFRLNSDKPEAIYDMYGDLIEESFEKFIWRLYHESPDYYLHLDEPKQL